VVTVTIDAPNQPPSVSLTSPANGSTLIAPATISIAANASDPENRLARVEFYSGSTLLGTDTAAPYTFAWSSVAAGTYTITAIAYDADGGKTTSNAVSVTVNVNQPPTVSLASPVSGAVFTAPATITLAGNAADPESRLARVEFYAGSNLILSDATSPFGGSWASVAAGTYTLTAVAYDADGGKTTSTPVTITVSLLPPPPTTWTVAFTASADHNTLVTSYRLDVFASGADPNTATPVASISLGKPTPDSTNTIAIDGSPLFTALAVGNYVATVSAIGAGGESRSAPLRLRGKPSLFSQCLSGNAHQSANA
jgi:hypothetical protein